MSFPIDLTKFQKQSFNRDTKFSADDEKILRENIKLIRDAIVFITGVSSKKGLTGHTGGAYPVHFDDAGHRVAIQYIMAAIKGDLPAEKLTKYREYDSKLPGHPELGMTPGIKFSSGRLGHMWAFLNGKALANPDKKIILYSSDGAFQEGNNDEAARFAAAKHLNIKLFIDDNNVTISGHPHDYLKGFDIEKLLAGHAVPVNSGDGENISELFGRIQAMLFTDGPAALVNKRFIAPGIDKIEDTPKGHDAIAPDLAVAYLNKAGCEEAAAFVAKQHPVVDNYKYRGSSERFAANRVFFGTILSDILEKLSVQERKNVVVIDSDLGGSCGLNFIKEDHNDSFIQSGILERSNFSAAAGFGTEPGKQGVFGTFAAFQEMILSELTMARLNAGNVLVHFSHSGVDDMADNTCHFGINNFFADNGLAEGDKTYLYYPADPLQLDVLMRKIFSEEGQRFIYTTRSKVPYILDEDGKEFFGNGYKYTGGDDIIREGKDGYIVTYGESLYRMVEASYLLKEKGFDIGVINKSYLNVADEKTMTMLKESPAVFVVETQNEKTGLGVRFGTWLLESGYKNSYTRWGSTKLGNSGLGEQVTHQELDPKSIANKIIKVLS